LSGRKVFTAGEVLQAADVNDFLMDQSVMVFAGTAARGSAIPSPSEGMISYLEDSNVWEGYTTSWARLGGKILQVVSATKTDTFSTTSTSFVDVPDLSVSITPTATSSKILVMFDAIGSTTNAGDLVLINIVRDSTAIAQSTGSGTQNQSYAAFPASTTASHHFGLTFSDSPSSTSALTYKIQTAGFTAATRYIGRYASNDGYRSVSTITVMEVAG